MPTTSSRTSSEEDSRTVHENDKAIEDPQGQQLQGPGPEHEKQDGGEKGPSKWDEQYEVAWSGPDDPDNPKSLPLWRKWLYVTICSSTASCVTCTSSIYTSIYGQVMPLWGISNVVATLGLSIFVFALGLSPMVLAPFSEFFGRRPIYIASLFAFTVWLIPCALAHNLQTMLIGRFFDGIAGAAFLSVVGGSISDLFDKLHLGAPMMMFTASCFVGPTAGPVLGGFINQFSDWRWSFYSMIIWSSVQFVLMIVIVPETYHPVLLRNKARQLRKETGDQRWHAPIEKLDRSIFWTVVRSCYRPFLLLTLEPMCLNLCCLSALLLGILYLFFGAIRSIYEETYGFELWQSGLAFVGILVGMLFAIALQPFWGKNYRRLVSKAEAHHGEPEHQLPPAIVGAPLVTFGLFWFSFTTYPSVHWIVSIVGSAFFGSGLIFCYVGIWTFLVDAYPLYAASAMAANSFLRSCFAAAFPLFGPAMYNKLGFQWASALLAFLSLALAPFPYIFYKYGARIRKKSKFTNST